MKTSLVVALAFALIGSVSFAAEKSATSASNPAKNTEHQHLNNVIKLDADGHRTALCGCGMQFEVSDKTLSMRSGDETIYCCSEACHTASMSMSDADRMKKISELNDNLSKAVLSTNSSTRNGHTAATCLCGKEFEVTDKTPSVSENGVCIHFCGEGCATGFQEMSAQDRLNAEKSITQAAAKPAKK